MMKKVLLAAAMLAFCGTIQTQAQEVNIGKNNITLQSDLMTPEALWAMGRIGAYAASPDGKQIVYTVAYYSVKENKSHHVICMMAASAWHSSSTDRFGR